MDLTVLPLAITMMLGPQIMSDIIFVTAPKPVRISLAFVAGVAIAATVGVIIMRFVASLFGISIPLGDPSDAFSIGNLIQYALVILLIALAIKNWVRRETIEPPAWLGRLQQAGPSLAFKTGLLVILLMPSDIIIMLTVGINLEHHGSSVLAALPFIAATVLVAALPILFYLLFRRHARNFMPKVRDWMNNNSWAVNIIVYLVFVVIILAG